MKKKIPNDSHKAKAAGATRTAADQTQPRPQPHTQPHDRLFKQIFSTREAQQDLVGMALPPEITSRFRMNTVRESGQETGSGRMDLLLTVETIDGSAEYVYVLVEHKSYRDRSDGTDRVAPGHGNHQDRRDAGRTWTQHQISAAPSLRRLPRQPALSPL